MQRFLQLLIFTLLLPTLLPAQGYNKLLTNGFNEASYSNMSIENDTLTMIGFCRDDFHPTTGIYLQKTDSLGNVMSIKSHFTDEDFWAGTYHQGFIKLKYQEGYAIVGTHFSTKRGYLLRLNNEGEFISLKRYIEFIIFLKP